MEGETNTWKVAFFSLLLVVIASGVGVGSFLYGRKIAPKSQETPSPLSATTEVTTTPTPTIDEKEELRAAIYKLTKLDETLAEVVINKIEGNYAEGGIKEYEAVSGAYWLAAKVGGVWIGVYAGQSHPTCAQIAPYDFSTELVPECINELGKVVPR